MTFEQIVFRIAGAWGVLILVPMYFLYDTIGRMYPPPLNDPMFFYGFLGMAMAWQIAFFVIATDPARFRPIMIPAMFEKFVFVATLLVLLAQGRIAAAQLAGGAADFCLGVLFVLAFLKTLRSEAADGR